MRVFESKTKSVCSGRKSSLRAQSRGTTKSHSSTEQVQSGKPVLNSNLKGVFQCYNQNFIQPPDSATLAISFCFLTVVVALMTCFFKYPMESTELKRISSVKLATGVRELQKTTLLHKRGWLHIKRGEGSDDSVSTFLEETLWSIDKRGEGSDDSVSTFLEETLSSTDSDIASSTISSAQ